MFQIFKQIKFEYLAVFSLAVLAGLMISVYNLSIIFLLISILFVLASFQYFNQMVLLLILYLPFQIALNITAGIDLASGRVLILYLFAVWIIKSLAEKRFVIKLNLQTLFLGAFLFLAIFSMLQAGDMERAIRKILVFLSIFPLYFILTLLSNKVGSGQCPVPTVVNNSDVLENKNYYIYKIIKMLLLGGVLISLIGGVQFILQFIFGIDAVMEFLSKYIAFIFYGQTFGAEVLSNPSWLVNISGATVLRAISLFPDPHMLSFYLGLVIPIVLSFIIFNKNNINFVIPVKTGIQDSTQKIYSKSVLILACQSILQRIVKYCGNRKNDKYTFCNNTLYFILFIMLLVELLTFSRGGYLGMIAGIGSVIVLGWKYISDFKKVFLGILFSISLFVALFTNQAIINRFLSSFNFSEGSNIERMKNWTQGAEVFSDNLLTGVGIGNYSVYLYTTIEYRTPVYAHNLYLDIGAEMGILELLCWLLLIGVTIWQLFRLSRRTKDGFSRALSLGLIGSLVWFSIHGIFDTPIYSPTILAMFVVIISLAAMVLEDTRHK